MTAISAIFWGLVVISLLVVLHEGGHFLAARAFGVRVTEFFLGMPCKARISRRSRKYGTEFGVTPILLGGYNRICGMEYLGNDRMGDVLALVQRDGTATASKVADELGMSCDDAYDDLLTLADWGSISRTRPSSKDEEGEDVFSTLERDANLLTMYDKGHDFGSAVSTGAGEARPIDDPAAFCEAERARTYEGRSWWQRILLLLAGPAVNIILAFALVIGSLMLVGVEVVSNTNVISGVDKEGLAYGAGLRGGDAIVEVAGIPTDTWQDISDTLDAQFQAAEPFELVYERDGARHTVEIDLPSDGSVTAIGVYATTERYRATFPQALLVASSYVAMVAKTVAELIIPTHTVEIVSQSSSVVGISVMASQAASAGAADFIQLLAAVSLSLGFMNLLPIPPLDGGKILIEIIQAVRRKRLSLRAQSIISYVGLGFFLLIFVFALFNDVTRIIG